MSSRADARLRHPSIAIAERDFARQVAGRGDFRITELIAASGWAIVRATAKLRPVASRTATMAVTASPVWMAQRLQLFGARSKSQRHRS
jgi:hypothetical protein